MTPFYDWKNGVKASQFKQGFHRVAQPEKANIATVSPTRLQAVDEHSKAT